LKYFDEIYKLQRELNIIIGKDTVEDPDKLKWSTEYFIALISEAVELMDCINWKGWTTEGKVDQYKRIIDLKNAKIEAIDCLHFVMSLIHVYDIKENMIGISQETSNIMSNIIEILWRCNDSLISSTRGEKWYFDIDDSIKYTQKLEYDSKQDIKRNIIICYRLLMDIFQRLEMSDDDILNIYKMKHEKNILRQKNNYSVLTKTEDDNNEIKDNI